MRGPLGGCLCAVIRISHDATRMWGAVRGRSVSLVTRAAAKMRPLIEIQVQCSADNKSHNLTLYIQCDLSAQSEGFVACFFYMPILQINIQGIN